MALSAEEQAELDRLEKEEGAYQAKKVSGIESLAGGAAQSASFGFADELEAGVRAALDPEKEYSDYIPDIRKRYELEKQANPWLYTGGEVAGAFLPGVGWAKAGKLAGKVGMAGAEKALGSIAGRTAIGAAEGAATGLGRSEDKSVSDALVGGAVGVALGYGGAKLGNYLAAKNASKISEPVDDISLKANQLKTSAESVFGEPEVRPDAEEVQKAWERLAPGKEFPPYLRTKDRETQRLASDVLESTSLAGKAERKALMPGVRGAEGVAEKIAEESGNLSRAEAGRQIRGKLSQEFEQSIKPAEEIYTELEDLFSGVPVRKQAINRALNQMSKDFGSVDISGKSKSLIENIRSFSSNLEDVAQLRKLRTSLNKSFDYNTLTDNEKAVLNRFYGVLTRERNRSILANVLEGAGKEASDLSRQDAMIVLNKLKEADSIFKGTLDKFSVLPIAQRRGVGMPSKIRGYLSEDTPLEQYVSDLFDAGDVEGLSRVKDRFPGIFEVLRKRALGEAVEKSTNKSTMAVNPRAVIGNVANIKTPEVGKMVLGNLAPDVSAAQKVYSALPQSFNPSQTATKLMDYNLFTPSAWGRQAEATAKRGLLRSGKVSDDLAENLFKSANRFNPVNMIKYLSQKPNTSQYSNMLQKALERGDAAYQSTYFLLQQSDPEFRKAIEENN